MKLRDIRAGEDHSFVRSYTLDGVAVRFRCRWFDRIGRWVIDMLAPDGEVLATGHAAPGGAMTTDPRDPRQPPGRLRWGPGPEPYTRSALGETVILYYDPAPPPIPIQDVTGYVRAVRGAYTP